MIFVKKMKKPILFILTLLLIVGFLSCKKEKCSYYNDIMKYYDQSEEAWTHNYEIGKIDSTDLQNQLYKIERERGDLQRLYKDCVKEE